MGSGVLDPVVETLPLGFGLFRLRLLQRSPPAAQRVGGRRVSPPGDELV